MTVGDALYIARETAKNEGWQLRPVNITRRRRWKLWGPEEWWIMAEGPQPESLSWVRIDGKSGEVIATGWRVMPKATAVEMRQSSPILALAGAGA